MTTSVLDDLVGVSADEVYRFLEGRGGDGLPVVGVSASNLTLMLASTVGDPNEPIALIPPLRGELTPRRLAICAVLAGCEPSHLPVVSAACDALLAPELNAFGFLTTTGSAAVAMIVNGPKVRDLGFAAGSNLLGPGHRANATAGRCLSLVLRIVGGAREGLADMATMGQPAKYGCCFAENEADSPWHPLPVDFGLDQGVNAVTVTTIAGTVEAFEPESADVYEMLQSIANVLGGSAPRMNYSGATIGGGQPLVLVSPEWAAYFHSQGLSKLDVQRELFSRSKIIQNDTLYQVAQFHRDILIVVAGGVGIKQTVMPNWNGGSRAVIRPIAFRSQ